MAAEVSGAKNLKEQHGEHNTEMGTWTMGCRRQCHTHELMPSRREEHTKQHAVSAQPSPQLHRTFLAQGRQVPAVTTVCSLQMVVKPRRARLTVCPSHLPGHFARMWCARHSHLSSSPAMLPRFCAHTVLLSDAIASCSEVSDYLLLTYSNGENLRKIAQTWHEGRQGMRLRKETWVCEKRTQRRK